MAIQELQKTGFEKWKEGIDEAVGNAKWDSWDCEIKAAVGEYNRHLSGVAKYMSLDWLLIKAMVWVETGAKSAEWSTRPMQIGITGDPGMASLLSGKEGSDLILPPAWRGRLTAASIRTNPAHNIRAGVGYLLMRMADSVYQSVLDETGKPYDVTVKPGDSLDKIARAEGSTVEALRELNPTVSMLRPGQVLKCQKASIQRVITGWRHISTASISRRYNGGGDPNYTKKLDYVLPLLQKGGVALCAE